MIGQLENKTLRVTNKRIKEFIKKHLNSFKTITSDNGSEFHGYKKLEEKLDVKFYFGEAISLLGKRI